MVRHLDLTCGYAGLVAVIKGAKLRDRSEQLSGSDGTLPDLFGFVLDPCDDVLMMPSWTLLRLRSR